MGRPSKGQRRQISLRLAPSVLSRIDAARGAASRDDYVTSLVVRASADPPVRSDGVPGHRHHPETYLRSQWLRGQESRVYACTCGAEVTR